MQLTSHAQQKPEVMRLSQSTAHQVNSRWQATVEHPLGSPRRQTA